MHTPLSVIAKLFLLSIDSILPVVDNPLTWLNFYSLWFSRDSRQTNNDDVRRNNDVRRGERITNVCVTYSRLSQPPHLVLHPPPTHRLPPPPLDRPPHLNISHTFKLLHHHL
ncbi:hypothetical protein Pcinc_000107 [Petrolisthes cinctipes]|uniref:Secreted protein n=1 Tax=Petrolisthes cinctipes TaxID=88211 RepID=A0AAE1L6M8_PETCI|nr:hypothetical protein Pcinc_000107 [Petrolisthes cinctipes]